jgi:hypothetical protein
MEQIPFVSIFTSSPSDMIACYLAFDFWYPKKNVLLKFDYIFWFKEGAAICMPIDLEDYIDNKINMMEL